MQAYLIILAVHIFYTKAIHKQVHSSGRCARRDLRRSYRADDGTGRFPSKAVTVIVPFQAGQGVDVMARALAVAPRGTL